MAARIWRGCPTEVISRSKVCSCPPSLNFTSRSACCPRTFGPADSSQDEALGNSSRSRWAADRLISCLLSIVSLVPYVSAYAENIRTIENAVKGKGYTTELEQQNW